MRKHIAILLALLLILQIISVASAASPKDVMVSVKALATDEARVLVQSLDFNNDNGVGISMYKASYSLQHDQELQEAIMKATSEGNNELAIKLIQEINQYRQIYYELGAYLPVDKHMRDLHPGFYSLVQNEMYTSDGSLILDKAEIFADMIADAINAAFIAAGRPDLALLEATITSDMNFSIYMSDGTPFSVIGCTQVLNTSICHGFLHLFCGFSSLSFTPTDHTSPHPRRP